MKHQREKLLEFVKEKHKAQVRKYTNEPYINHLINVAKKADGKCTYGYEIGLCHDLFEDTDCEVFELFKVLSNSEYSRIASHHIIKCVQQLTDQYTSKAYPRYNRAVRKKLEAERLFNVYPDAQTVKYADLIDNTESIVQYDKNFAQVYLDEKQYILSKMNRGNKELYSEALDTLFEAKNQLEK